MTKILLIEDNEMNRDMLARRLRRQGYWVDLAEDGKRALALCDAERYDLVLLDVMMPEMDGITTFGHLQDDPATRDIPVVLLTAKSHVGPNQPWDGLAVSGVLAKPFSPMELPRDVAALLGWETR